MVRVETLIVIPFTGPILGPEIARQVLDGGRGVCGGRAGLLATLGAFRWCDYSPRFSIGSLMSRRWRRRLTMMVDWCERML